MSIAPGIDGRRTMARGLTAVALGLGVWSTTTQAQAQAGAPMPYYSAAQAMTGLYAHELRGQAAAFAQQADALAIQSERYCRSDASLASLRLQWQQALAAWSALSTPALGPLLARRSQRQIDFWPPRPRLLDKALAMAPRNLQDMEMVGTPAKGLPAMEWLLWAQPAAPQTATCAYLRLLSSGIAAEAQALDEDLRERAETDWQDHPEATAAAMAEWVNQWLAGLERLRWAHLEKPIRSAPKGQPPRFPRLQRDSNLLDWKAQWQSLRAQGGLTPAQRETPPNPAQSLIPIEALLIGKGQLALAQRWAQALDQAQAAMDRLQGNAKEPVLLETAQSLRALALLFQNEVAAALDIPIGFSDADGD